MKYCFAPACFAAARSASSHATGACASYPTGSVLTTTKCAGPTSNENESPRWSVVMWSRDEVPGDDGLFAPSKWAGAVPTSAEPRGVEDEVGHVVAPQDLVRDLRLL